MREAFNIALQTSGESIPQRCLMVDDLPHTTRAARDFGFYSILYGNDGNLNEANATLKNLLDLPSLIDNLD